MSELGSFIENKVRVITCDAKLFEGTLQGYDRQANVIIANCIERVISRIDENEEMDMGTYIIRGDTVVCVGLIDSALDAKIDWSKVLGDELRSTKNPL